MNSVEAVPAFSPPLAEAIALGTNDGSSFLPPPPSNPSAPSRGNSSRIHTQYNEAGIREFLSGELWPIGLQDTFIQNLQKIPMRFFICDDSGSMIANDGHRLMDSPKGKK